MTDEQRAVDALESLARNVQRLQHGQQQLLEKMDQMPPPLCTGCWWPLWHWIQIKFL
jgi:hypothetical protein